MIIKMTLVIIIAIILILCFFSMKSKAETFENPVEQKPKIFCNYYSEKEDKVVYGEVEPEKCQIPPLKM